MPIILFTVAPQPNNINPYSYAAGTYTTGLTTIVASLAGGTLPPTPAILNTDVLSYLQPLYYAATPPLDQVQKLQAILGNVYNAYLQPQASTYGGYNPAQLALIGDIMDGIDSVPVNQLAGSNFWQVTEENVALSSLSIKSQAPIFMALAIAEAAYTYFYAQILSPSANWATFIDSSAAVNFMNFNGWIKAAFRGALIGYKLSTPLTPTTAVDCAGIGDNFISTLLGAFALTFGQIIFQWVPRPTLSCPVLYIPPTTNGQVNSSAMLQNAAKLAQLKR